MGSGDDFFPSSSYFYKKVQKVTKLGPENWKIGSSGDELESGPKKWPKSTLFEKIVKTAQKK